MTKLLILDFITSFGGVQRVMANVLPSLARKVDVTFIDALENLETRQILEKSGVKVRHLAVWPKFRALGYKKSAVHRLGLLLLLGPSYFLYIVRVAVFARRQAIDVIYTNSKKGLVIAVPIGLMTKKSVVYHIHGVFGTLSPLYRWAIGHAQGIIAVSNDVKHKLQTQGIPEGRITVIHNAVDPLGLVSQAAESPCTIPEGFNCLVACSIQHGKGIHVALKAVHTLKQRGLQVNLLVAGEVVHGGDRRYQQELDKLVQALDIKDRVFFLGWQSRLPALIEQCAVVLVPSIIEESFGMVSIEAMAVGRPVIASRIGGIPEVVKDNETGFLVDPDSAEDLADKIRVLYDNESLCTQFGAAGRRWVDAQFTVLSQAEKISAVVSAVHHL